MVQAASNSSVQEARDYVTAIGAATAHPVSLWNVQDGNYTDAFYRGKACDPGDPGKVDGFRYSVTAPAAGVVYITRTDSRCTQNRKLTEAKRAQVLKDELAMELAEDGDDVPASTMPTGVDANDNGVPDYVDVAAYAGSGQVKTTPAAPGYVEWDQAVSAVTTQAELIAIDSALLRLTTKYGDVATRKIVDVIVRAMFSTANHLDQAVLERAVVAELSQVVIERELTSVVGHAAAETMRTGVITAGREIIERNGVRYLSETLGEAGARTLAGMLTRYATRLGMSAGVALVPVVGEVVLVVMDVYFTVQLILDIADLLGFNLWGDPHLVTMDRRAYDLQAAGEFVLAQADGTASMVQGRFEPSGTTVSFARRVVLGDGAERFELTDAGALLDGQPLSLDGFTVTTSGMMLAHVAGNWIATTKDGLSILGSSATNVRVVAGADVRTSGLLGNNDGDPANDIAMPDGTVLSTPSIPTLHGPYADAWRVAQNASLFTYAAGESTATYTDRSFPQNVVTLGDFTPAQIDAANATCIRAGVSSGAMMDACVLDTLVTSDTSFAASAAATRSVVDYSSSTFDAAGVLTQGFDGAIPMAMQFPTTVQVNGTSRAVGPLFDDAPYSLALLSVPRHDAATVKARILVLGSAASGSRQVAITADGVTSGTYSLEGNGSVMGGSTGASITADGTGVTPTGTAYKAYLSVVT